MSASQLALLDDRGVVAVSGLDSEKLLQGLITNDMSALTSAPALYAGLLSPQGKILFDFFVIRTHSAFFIDVAADKSEDLVKRLKMYKLRADADIRDESQSWSVWAGWTGGGPGPDLIAPQTIASLRAHQYVDPRLPSLGSRHIFARGTDRQILDAAGLTQASPAGGYHAHRIALGVPEGGRDYQFGDTYPHEANFDLLNGVSFSKGCYVGQEIVARMQNKAIVRKRVVKVSAGEALQAGAEVMMGEVAIGRIGSTAGGTALALLRLDRALEAIEKGVTLTAGGVALEVATTLLDRYRKEIAARPGTAFAS